MSKKLFKLSLLLAILLFAYNADAKVSCSFDRDLEEGVVGEDVRCLQKFLNESGYVIAPDGVGSPGKETNLFRTLTKEAVREWQEKHGLPTTGYFGPKSKAKYHEVWEGVNDEEEKKEEHSNTSETVQALKIKISELQTALANAKKSSEGDGEDSSEKKEAEKAITRALDMMDEAGEQIDDSDEDTTVAKKDLEDAEEALFDAVRALFVDKDYVEAIDLANDAFDDAEEAFEDAGGESEEDEVDDLIDEADEAIDQAEEEIETAEDNDKEIDKSMDLLDEAKDKLDEAREAYDDEDYDEAEDLAEEAIDLADEAIDEIGEN